MVASPQSWSPELYRQFEAERTRPARDLLAQVGDLPDGQVVDMGCGPGNSTELLVQRFEDREVIGLDTSVEMLDDARRRLPGTRFEVADASSWLPDGSEALVFANAIYQWVPDNLDVLTRTFTALRPGAVLAVQMPDNRREPSHVAMDRVAEGGTWAGKLVGVARPPLPPSGDYIEALAPLGDVDVWLTIYNFLLDGPDAIVDWVRGTGLRPFLDPLEAEEKADFLAAYRAEIAEAYPPLADGRSILRFPRLFIVARRRLG